MRKKLPLGEWGDTAMEPSEAKTDDGESGDGIGAIGHNQQYHNVSDGILHHRTNNGFLLDGLGFIPP